MILLESYDPTLYSLKRLAVLCWRAWLVVFAWLAADWVTIYTTHCTWQQGAGTWAGGRGFKTNSWRKNNIHWNVCCLFTNFNHYGSQQICRSYYLWGKGPKGDTWFLLKISSLSFLKLFISFKKLPFIFYFFFFSVSQGN